MIHAHEETYSRSVTSTEKEKGKREEGGTRRGEEGHKEKEERKKLVAAAVRLDALAQEGAQEPGAARAPKRARRGARKARCSDP